MCHVNLSATAKLNPSSIIICNIENARIEMGTRGLILLHSRIMVTP